MSAAGREISKEEDNCSLIPSSTMGVAAEVGWVLVRTVCFG